MIPRINTLETIGPSNDFILGLSYFILANVKTENFPTYDSALLHFHMIFI